MDQVAGASRLDAGNDGSARGGPGERFPFTKSCAPAVDATAPGDRPQRFARAPADHRVVLVRAPAGSGKTTLLATWAAQARERVAWLRVDQGDVAADLLAAALHHAAARVVPALGHRVPHLLAGRGVARDQRALATALVNDPPCATSCSRPRS